MGPLYIGYRYTVKRSIGDPSSTRSGERGRVGRVDTACTAEDVNFGRATASN